MLARSILATVALVAAYARAQGQLVITDPSPTAWWVANSQNTLAWNCGQSGHSAYTVVLSNSDKTILVAPLALIANVPDYDCSFAVSDQQSTQRPSATYSLSLTNPQNISDIYATNQFEIKAVGSTYPATSASASGTATGTNSAGSSSSTSGSKTGAAVVNYIPMGMSMAAALVLGLVVA